MVKKNGENGENGEDVEVYYAEEKQNENDIITNESTDKIAKMGVFMSFQTPIDIPGISLAHFLKTTKKAITGETPSISSFSKEVNNNMKELSMDSSYTSREFNVGFSGGERKKNEILQMLTLNPKLAILDETDSGLDVDAIKTVSKGIDLFKNDNNSILIITHSMKLLKDLHVDKVHILINGKIVKSGDQSLVKLIEKQGFQNVSTKKVTSIGICAVKEKLKNE